MTKQVFWRLSLSLWHPLHPESSGFCWAVAFTFTTHPQQCRHLFLGCLPDLSPDCSHPMCPAFELLVPSIPATILAWLNHLLRCCPDSGALTYGPLQTLNRVKKNSQMLTQYCKSNGRRGTTVHLHIPFSCISWLLTFIFLNGGIMVYFILATPWGMQDLSSPIRNWTLASCCENAES